MTFRCGLPGAGCSIVVEKNTPPVAMNVTLLDCFTQASGDNRTYISDDGLSVVRTHNEGGSQILVSSNAGITWNVLKGGQITSHGTPAVFDLVGAGNVGFTRNGVFEVFSNLGA